MFIVLEGLNGSGKSSQIPLLAQYFKEQGREVLTLREPGGSVLGERIREILLYEYKREEDKVHPYTQAALFIAARTQLYHTIIRPALDSGQTVISDRWTASTIAYQGYAIEDGPPPEDILAAADLFLQGTRPNATLILDVPVEEALERRRKMKGDRLDRYEASGIEFQRNLAFIYKRIAETYPNHRLVPATGSVQEVHQRILAALKELQGAPLG